MQQQQQHRSRVPEEENVMLLDAAEVQSGSLNVTRGSVEEMEALIRMGWIKSAKRGLQNVRSLMVVVFSFKYGLNAVWMRISFCFSDSVFYCHLGKENPVKTDIICLLLALQSLECKWHILLGIRFVKLSELLTYCSARNSFRVSIP